MYKCPKQGCENTEHFWRETIWARMETQDASGKTIGTTYDELQQASPARCKECNARAEWIDSRQTELFPISSTFALDTTL